jgi:hypothetical protein
VAAPEKRARRQNALIVFEDESGVSLLPSVRATWAPRGHTPVLQHRFNWKRLSLASARAYEPDGSDAHLVFQLRPGAYNDETLIEFLSVEVAVEPSQERGGAGVGARVLIASGLLARANLRTVFRSRCRCLAMACSRLRAPRGPGPPPSARGSVASARS